MRSIDECIALFNLRDGSEYRAIRQMEMLGQWEIAAEYWDKVGKTEDAAACRLIVSATKEGDRIRSQQVQMQEY